MTKELGEEGVGFGEREISPQLIKKCKPKTTYGKFISLKKFGEG